MTTEQFLVEVAQDLPTKRVPFALVDVEWYVRFTDADERPRYLIYPRVPGVAPHVTEIAIDHPAAAFLRSLVDAAIAADAKATRMPIVRKPVVPG